MFDYNKEFTPENLTKESLKDSDVFVFGSNESGIHGGGAARYAYDNLGAKWGNGTGLQGKSYAIPTKDYQIKTLPLQKIQIYINDFINFAYKNSHLKFFVTKIGCGLAGLTVKDIAPMFKNVDKINNIILPEEFVNYIKLLK